MSGGPIPDDADLRAAHKRCGRNRAILAEGGPCGCFYCLSVFEASEVRDWVWDGSTALCPRCGIDAVLPGSAAPIDAEFLRRMRTRWFECTVRLDPDAPWPPG